MPVLTEYIYQQNIPYSEIWIIQAPVYHLDRYCLESGMGPDSAVPVSFKVCQDPFDPARLTFPGAKCPWPEPWLKVLGLLYVNHVSFHLYLGEGSEKRPKSLTLIRPSIQKELREILGLAAAGRMAELKKYEDLFSHAFSLIRKRSTRAARDQTRE